VSDLCPPPALPCALPGAASRPACQAGPARRAGAGAERGVGSRSAEAEQGPSPSHGRGGGLLRPPGLALRLSPLCSCATSHLPHRIHRDRPAQLSAGRSELHARVRPGLLRVTGLRAHRGTRHSAGPGRSCPRRDVYCSEMVSISEVFVLSSVRVQERPRGQLSASSRPQTTGLKASHMAVLVLSRGPRDSAHTRLPIVQPGQTLPAPSPVGLPPGQHAGEAGGCPVPEGSSSAGLCGDGAAKAAEGRASCAAAPSARTDAEQGGDRWRWEHQPAAWIFSSPWRQLSAPAQTLVTLASQSKRPLVSCEGELGRWCERTQRCFQLAPSLLLALSLGHN